MSRVAVVAVATLVAVAVAFTLGCRRAPAPLPCPAGFTLDGARAGALLAALRGTDEGAALVSRVSAPRICFGEPPVSMITTEGVLLLDGRLDDPEAAARTGHLLLHLTEGSPALEPGDAGCDAAVSAALGAEARAFALELRLRRALGVTRPRLAFAFEAAFWAAPIDAREGLIAAYLHAHPDGAPGLDALAAGYTERCRRASRP